MLRRMKCDVDVEVPPKREILVYAPMTQQQQQQYKSIVDRTIRRLVEKDYVRKIAPRVLYVNHKSTLCTHYVFSFVIAF